jgi:polar amino acid transport system permease protein
MSQDWWSEIMIYGPGFWAAAQLVLWLTLLIILVSWACGLAAALGKLSKIRVIRAASDFYVWFIRGTPTLIQVFIVYFGLPQFGVKLSPFTAGVIALGVNSGAYVAEIVRAGLSAIPNGQTESSLALGINRFDTMRRIILPQVFRIIVPPITNEAITALKNTSLLSTITVIELTLFAQTIIATTFRPFEFYTAVALIYLLLTTILTQLSSWLERHYAALS